MAYKFTEAQLDSIRDAVSIINDSNGAIDWFGAYQAVAIALEEALENNEDPLAGPERAAVDAALVWFKGALAVNSGEVNKWGQSKLFSLLEI